MGVLAEGIASRLMARGTVLRLLDTGRREGKADVVGAGETGTAGERDAGTAGAGDARNAREGEVGSKGVGTRARRDEELTYGRIVRFYYPLALTSVIGLAAQPMLTFFMARAVAPLESLAVFPVVISLIFIFRSMGLSFQEVGIALMGRNHEHIKPLARFATVLGLSSMGCLALVAFTPLVDFWFVTVSGLGPELARFALIPTAILVPIPILSVLLSFQRGILVVARRTRPITVATALEVGGIAVLFPLLGWHAGMVGVTAAALAILLGRLASNSFLLFACKNVLDASAWRRGQGDTEVS
jgi:hypothetical protein